MRLDKLLSNRNYGSRKDVKKLCKDGLVKVNDKKVTKSDYKVCEGDVISIDDIEWKYSEFEYIMLNKPQGCVSANFDNVHNTVFDYLPDDFVKTFHIVGRLDIDTEGLVIVTNDGQFIHKVISPNNKVGKVYEVELKNPCEESYVEEFKNGVVIDEDYKCMSAKLEISDTNKCLVTLYEGKFHQVKKMFLALGNEVTRLKRLSIGKLELGDLEVGDYNYIDKEEIYNLCIENPIQ